MTFIGLHGFLGRPQDWQGVTDALTKKNPQMQFLTPDLFHEVSLSPETLLSDWGRNFSLWLRQKKIPKPWILSGYSMGGRLALQAWRHQPQDFAAVILLSTHPGLSQTEAKREREKNDAAWADQFSKVKSDLDFQNLLKAWNAQAVFNGDHLEPARNLTDYDLSILSLALRNWSLAQQEDFSDLLKAEKDSANANMIHWFVGGRDKRYKNMAKELLSGQEVEVISGAGHRLIFHPSLASHLRKFI